MFVVNGSETAFFTWRVYQEHGLFTYFADPWITERERRIAVDREVEFRDSLLYQSMKRIKPIVYGEFDPLTLHF